MIKPNAERKTSLFWFTRGLISKVAGGTVAAVEVSDRKDLNTLYKFRNLISVNRIFIKDYKVSVSIWHIRSESRVTFEMPQLSDLQKCVRLRDGVSIIAIVREMNVDNVWVTFWETSLSVPLESQKFGVVKVSEFSTAATVRSVPPASSSHFCDHVLYIYKVKLFL
jgi:hypothetical protein